MLHTFERSVVAVIENLLVCWGGGGAEHVVSGQQNLWLETDKGGEVQTATPFPNYSVLPAPVELQSLIPFPICIYSIQILPYICTRSRIKGG